MKKTDIHLFKIQKKLNGKHYFIAIPYFSIFLVEFNTGFYLDAWC